LYLFALFVGPDNLLTQLPGYDQRGAPADIKKHYQDEFLNDTNCMSLFGRDYGFDFVGNLSYGYLGAHAGLPPDLLLNGAGMAQIFSDLFSGQRSSVDFNRDRGDSPEDQVAVIMGMTLYALCGAECTKMHVDLVLSAFRQPFVNAARESNTGSCKPES
jgi:hypothetical protein